MSRIGRLPIAVPSGVDVAIDGQTVKVTGPKGNLAHTVAAPITVDSCYWSFTGAAHVTARSTRSPPR